MPLWGGGETVPVVYADIVILREALSLCTIILAGDYKEVNEVIDWRFGDVEWIYWG